MQIRAGYEISYECRFRRELVEFHDLHKRTCLAGQQHRFRAKPTDITESRGRLMPSVGVAGSKSHTLATSG
jgi:hypothetical protein